MEFLSYPILLVKFYYVDVTVGFLKHIFSHTRYFIYMLSIPLMFKTFFKPLKGEYRNQLVVFSIVAGMIIKFVLLSVSTVLLLLFIIFEFTFFVLFLIFPFLAVYLFLNKI